MQTHIKPIISTVAKNWLPALVIILATLVLWRVGQVFNAPNLLQTPGQLAAWRVAHQGNAQARQVEDNLLQLELGDPAAGSWVGIGQQIAVEPAQPYRVQVNYRLPAEAPAQPPLILRVSQIDGSGQTITSQEFMAPPAVNGAAEAGWQRLDHTFTAAEQATAVEVGVGLFGQQAAVVEIGGVALQRDLDVLKTVSRDPLLVGLAGLLLAGAGYRFRHYLSRRGAAIASGLRARRRVLGMVAVNLILFVLFAELLALALYFARGDGLFYTGKKSLPQLGGDAQQQELTAKRVHPYFGYVDKPGWQREEDDFWRNQLPRLKTINNHGLGSEYDYPFIKTGAEQYIIGIFGGSVAERFTLLTKERLVANLQADPFFAGREVVVLNFAKGGYKQPQQLLLLSYFLSIGQEFDMVINIDGFNEVAFSHRNYQRHVDTSMPHVNIMEGLSGLMEQSALTPEKLEALARINQTKLQLNGLAEKINGTPLASVGFVLEQYYQWKLGQYRQALHRFDALEAGPSGSSLLFLKPDERELSDPLLFGQIAGHWAKSSVMMDRTLAGEGAVYYHFLQPNQYYSNKAFSAKEAAQALEQEHPYYSTLVQAGYPYLIERIGMVEAAGVFFFNAVPIFDRETEIVYIDNCCHYNQRGNEILADFIATTILETGHY